MGNYFSSQPNLEEQVCKESQPNLEEQVCKESQPNLEEQVCKESQLNLEEQVCKESQPNLEEQVCKESQPNQEEQDCKESQPNLEEQVCKESQPNLEEQVCKESQPNLEEQVCKMCLKKHIPVVAMIGHSSCLETLIKAWVITAKCSRQLVYQEALEWAAQKGQIECVKVLIEAGADVNKKHDTRLRGSAVYEAACNGNEACLNLLIKAGADVNRVTKTGHTTLMKTIRCGHPKCVSLLIEAGADVNAKDPDGNSALTFAAKNIPGHRIALNIKPDRQLLLQILINAGTDVNSADKDGNTPLIIVSGSNMKCHIQFVKSLLRSEAKVNLFNNKEQNALCNHICKSKALNKAAVRTMVLLLYAAGETLDGITVDEHVLDYLDKREIYLKELCREVIRRHLLYLNLHQSLFGKIPQLGLPKLLAQYLLCNMSLDTNTE